MNKKDTNNKQEKIVNLKGTMICKVGLGKETNTNSNGGKDKK